MIVWITAVPPGLRSLGQQIRTLSLNVLCGQPGEAGGNVETHDSTNWKNEAKNLSPTCSNIPMLTTLSTGPVA